jgi:hypothetical protein
MMKVRAPGRSASPDLVGTADPWLPTGWLLGVLFVPLLLWWASGLQGFIGIIIAVPLLVVVAVRGWWKVPSGFWLWLMFLAWVPVTLVMTDSFTSLLVAVWRYSIYLAAGVLFLYVFNAPKRELPTDRVIRFLAGFWMLTVAGGMIGALLPRIEFTSPVEIAIRGLAQADPLLRLMIHPSTSLARSFEALALHRPNAPFPDPNQWGGNFALSLPYALALLGVIRSPTRRVAMWCLLFASLIPLVISLDRGAWLACLVALSYAAVRLAVNRNIKALAALVLSGAVVAALMLGTSLGQFAVVRLQNAPGDDRRILLYENAIVLAGRSPILGYAGTVALNEVVRGAPPNPPIGTHGQFWLVMISYGVFPALFLFIGWLVWAFVATGRRGRSPPGTPGWMTWPSPDSNARFWCHVSLLVALVELPYYELIPWGLPLVMTGAALALREQRSDIVRSVPVQTSGPNGWEAEA